MSQTNKDFLNILYTELKKYRGSLQTITDRTGKSREWVRFALQGKIEASYIILAATKVLKEYKDKDTANIEEAKQILNKVTQSV